MAGTTTYYGISYPTATDYVKDGASNMQTIAEGFDSAVAIPTYNNQTGTTYTFVLADAGKTVTSNNASAVTFTIPPQSSVAWANNTTLTVRNLGAGVVTIAGGAGVTVTNTAQTVAQYGEVKLIRTASNAWTVVPASGGASGLTLITSQTLTTSSGYTFQNVFSSTYQNYLIKFTGTASVTAAANLIFDMANAGTRVNTANWTQFMHYSSNSSTSWTGSYAAGQNASNTIVLGNLLVSGEILVERPFDAEKTALMVNSLEQSNTDFYAQVAHSVHNLTTSYDGFYIAPSSGTITANVRVYGYKNS